jgi:LPS-assembly protein
MPLFINVNKNSDLTISPTYYFSTNQIIVSNDWRQKIKYGSYNLNLELANNNIENNNIDKMIIKRSHKPIRWQINGVGNFNFTKNWGMDYAVQNISDRNYLRDYNFNYLAYTNSKINFDYINSRSYFGIKSMKFQEIENNNLEKTAPTILPSINTSFETSPLFFKEKFILATNFTSIKRDQGLQYNRGTIVPSFKFPFNIKGNLFEFSAKMQNDFYVLNDKDLRNYSDQKIYKSFQSDLKREMSINWRLPLRNKSLNRTITIEPMANFVVSDYKSKNSNIPLEDSINSELTFSNLFVNDRISGFDRNEAGQRISYGLKSSIFNKLGELNFTAGQAMIIKKNDQDIKIRGFAENNKSNIVGIVSFKGKKYFSISYSFQLDQVNYRNDVNQVFANLNYKKFDFTVDYLLIRKNINNLKEREQATFINSFELFEKWYFKTFLTRDFVEKRNIQRGIEITRNGCCSNFGFSIIERNQSSLTKPQKTFNINFTIKNL